MKVLKGVVVIVVAVLLLGGGGVIGANLVLVCTKHWPSWSWTVMTGTTGRVVGLVLGSIGGLVMLWRMLDPHRIPAWYEHSY